MAVYHLSAKLFQRSAEPGAVAAVRRAAAHLPIARHYGVRILAEPDLVLAALARERATFTRQDLARFINTHTADAAQFEAVMVSVEGTGELAHVGTDDCGRDRFSTKKIAAVGGSSKTAP
jgi:hypothetical protein